MLRRLIPLALLATAQAQSPDTSDWGHYGGDAFGQRYSSLAEINRENVAKLAVAWQFRTGELGEGFERSDKLAFEATPVLAFGLLYLTTPTSIVIALDPATGQQRWRYDPRIDRKRRYSQAISRGVSVWEDAGAKSVCARRVFFATLDARVIALNAGTGQPCPDFGRNGAVDLTEGLRIRDPNEYPAIAPPVVQARMVIVRVAGEGSVARAFDARTGALRWTADAASSQAVISVDADRGLVFIPSGSTLLALSVANGKPVWQRELIHHDLWNYALAAQPLLVDLELQGASIPAVVQATQTGLLFAFERNGGQPVFPVVEQRVPHSHVPGEKASATQPFPVTPVLVAQTPLSPQDAWGLTFWDRRKCRQLIARLRNEGLYTPPDTRGTILQPGIPGGVGWGGLAFDTRQQRVFAAVNHLPMQATAIPKADLESQRRSGKFPNAQFVDRPGAAHAIRHEPLLSPWGLPCTAPPWGTLASVDLRTNRLVWQVPLGSTEGFGPKVAPVRDFGTPNAGGPIVTAGELVFVGAAMDSYFRAYDAETGSELWKYKLPAGGQATPMTYRAGEDHRQFVVIAAGGHAALNTPRGDHVVAFALPR